MSRQNERQWLLAALVVWVIVLAGAIGSDVYVHRRTAAIVERMVETDPSSRRRALRLRLEADQLVRNAFRRHEAATSGSASAAVATGTLVAEAAPLLEQAERLYLESLDVGTSQPALLFQLGEVNFLLGRKARAYLFMARYWESIGENELARSYRRRARDAAPGATVPAARDAETTGPG